MTTINRISRAFVVAVACIPLTLDMPVYAQVCTEWKEATRIGELQSQLQEASGLAVSRKFPGRMYLINDSGDTGRFYITGMDGKNTRAVNIGGFVPVDTEALSLGPCPGAPKNSCLFIGDIGDNDLDRKAVEVAVVDETSDFGQTAKQRTHLMFRYPDGRPHDAESMAVHPDGTLYILTKETPARLFKANPTMTTQTLTLVATLDLGTKPTDMAISDDGTKLLVLTYKDAFEYSFDLKHQQKITLAFLQQQESVAYLPGSRSFIYTTERLFPLLSQPIMRADCAR